MWTPRNLALAAVSAVSTFSSLAAAAAAADSVPFTVPTAFHSSRIIPPIHYAHTPPQTGSSSGLSTFVGVRGASSLELGNAGPYILDENGDVVWYGGTKSVLNFGSHTYKGEPVLAFYTGSYFLFFSPLVLTRRCCVGSEEFPGYGHGQWQLYNSSYDLITTVESKGTGAANSTDPHDVRQLSFTFSAFLADSSSEQFTITPDDTAIIEDWRPRQVDLRSLGGAEDGWAFDCIVQEVNIETGELVWQWSSLDHVPVSETFYEVIGGAGTMEQRESIDLLSLPPGTPPLLLLTSCSRSFEESSRNATDACPFSLPPTSPSRSFRLPPPQLGSARHLRQLHHLDARSFVRPMLAPHPSLPPSHFLSPSQHRLLRRPGNRKHPVAHRQVG